MPALIPALHRLEEYQQAYHDSLQNPAAFWGALAEHFVWKSRWKAVCSGGFGQVDFRWFEGATLNITENCLDRHLPERAQQPALIWEPNNPAAAARRLTYSELHTQVCRFSAVLSALGVKKGDTVCIYMPMIPEAVIAMLSCARLGAIHSVVFGGFSASSLSERINDAGCTLLLTADGHYRGDKPVMLKSMADEALEKCPGIRHCVVYNRSDLPVEMKPGRDLWWNDLLEGQTKMQEAVAVDAEDPLFILYTSGSTGKPKGVVHTTGGYMVYAAYTFKNVFQYREQEVFWCTADIGWITGHSYLVYGPLLNGATILMYEGVPQFPDWGRWWDIIDKYKVNIFYTAPTAIRSLEAQGLKFLENKDLSSLRILGSVGEPINEEAWDWYHKNVGRDRCPIADTWWQTETGGILISSLAGVTPEKPSFATLPLPGIEPVLVDALGQELTDPVAEGNLCIRRSWPGQARTVYGDHARFVQTYFTTYPNLYFTGDGCRRDADGHYRITGRVDDVMNVSGHRIGTAEVENAINEHDWIVESAVVGFPHPIKGQGIHAFVICTHPGLQEEVLRKEVLDRVSKMIGSFARPDRITISSGLPKTRSGKIMRRILRKLAEGLPDQTGDVSTLLNPEIVEELKRKL